MLESTAASNPEELALKQVKSEVVHIQMGAELTGKAGNAAVTPLVKTAIEYVRRFDNPDHHSVETANDVETLMLYERHLRDELALKYKLKSEAKEVDEKLTSTSTAGIMGKLQIDPDKLIESTQEELAAPDNESKFDGSGMPTEAHNQTLDSHDPEEPEEDPPSEPDEPEEDPPSEPDEPDEPDEPEKGSQKTNNFTPL